jgi:hypothetical protein
MLSLTDDQSRQLAATLRRALPAGGGRRDFSLTVVILTELLGVPYLRTCEVLLGFIAARAFCDRDVLPLLTADVLSVPGKGAGVAQDRRTPSKPTRKTIRNAPGASWRSARRLRTYTAARVLCRLRGTCAPRVRLFRVFRSN